MKYKNPFAGNPLPTMVTRMSSYSYGGPEVKVTAPEQWSQLAVDMLTQKYMRKAGVPARTVPEEGPPGWEFPTWLRPRVPAPETTFGGETSAAAVFHRLAGCWTHWGWVEGYFDEETDAENFYAACYYCLAWQMAAPASPQWFNTGLHWAYGVTGDASGTYSFEWDGPTRVVAEVCPDGFSRPQAHACFIQGVKDDLVGPGGIMDLWMREARAFKYGGGSGSNFSEIRGAGEPLSGGGKASGLLSFLKIGDKAAGSIKSGGTVRRAAKMGIVDVDHPDVEEYIDWKVEEEKKVAALAAGSALLANYALDDTVTNANVPDVVLKHMQDAATSGTKWDFTEFNTDFQGEGYATVSGQNANNSINVSRKFMEAVQEGGYWGLIGRVEKRKAAEEGRDPTPCKVIKAKDLWDRINNAAWHCADPGLFFGDTINEWNPTATPIKASNPCCLIGSTLVDTSEGRISIKRLAKMDAEGEELPLAFAYDKESGRPVLRKIKRAWMTKKTRNLVKVTTDKGVEITCTPDHRFLTYQGGYVQADRLSVGTSLRKIARHVNYRRSGRVMISDKGLEGNGTEYQSRWMWEQVNGPIPDGYEVHHVNEDCRDDRLSNLVIKEESEHRLQHTVGEANPRFLRPTDAQLLRVHDWLEANPNCPGRDYLTPTRWNKAIRKLGLLGIVPLVRGDGRVQGVDWDEFHDRVMAIRQEANDKVIKIEQIRLDESVPAYDIEVEGVHNLAVTHKDEVGTATIVVHNCEYLFLDDTACNLASLNLVKFYGEKTREFDCTTFEAVVDLFTTVLDITVGMAGYPSEALAVGSGTYRTLGLGYANLGAVLMRMGLRYDSDLARQWAGGVTALMQARVACTSATIAEAMGKYPGWDHDRGMRVLRNHATVVDENMVFDGLTYEPSRYIGGFNPVTSRAKTLYKAALDTANRTGLRNAQLTLLAPTGTIGLLMDCDTTGVEPDFALVKYKKMVGGGTTKIVNRSVRPALDRLGYGSSEIEKIEDWIIQHGTVEGSPDLSPSHLGVFDCATKCGEGIRSLHWRAHLLMMAAVQPSLSGGISKTVNMDETASKNDIDACNMTAWTLGLKANAVYRDGSKLSQPLTSKPTRKPSPVVAVDLTANQRPPAVQMAEAIEFAKEYMQGMEKLERYTSTTGMKVVQLPQTHGERRKLPAKRKGWTYKLRIGGQPFYVRTGEYEDGTLGEIFLDLAKQGSSLRSWAGSLAMSVSIGLQHGVSLDAYVRTFVGVKFEPQGLVQGHPTLKMASSIVDAAFRLLGIEYLKMDGLGSVQAEKTRDAEEFAPITQVEAVNEAALAKSKGYAGEACLTCGEFTLVRRGSCLTCDSCGATSGCG